MVAGAARISSGVDTNIGVSPVRHRRGPAAATSEDGPPRRRDGRKPSDGRTRRGGLVLRADPTATLPVCRPSDWLRALELALEQPAIVRVMRRRRRGPGTLLAVARAFADHADFRTGRNVAVSFATIADQLHCENKTVKKAVQFLSFLGFHIEAVHGRNILSLDELAAARAAGAVDQTAIASTRHLVIPSWARRLLRAAAAGPREDPSAVSSAPLPPLDLVNDQSPVKESLQRRASAHTAGAPRRRALNEVFDLGGSLPAWRPGVQDFAAELVRKLPELLRTSTSKPARIKVQLPDGRIDEQLIGGRHIGQVCSVVARERLVERGWTVLQVIEHVGKHAATLRVSVPLTEQRDPLAWFVWILRRAIGQDQLSPTLRAQLDRDAARAENEARRAADEQRRERIAAEQPEIDRIIADMHRQFPRLPRRR